jgi:hypothetical protein
MKKRGRVILTGFYRDFVGFLSGANGQNRTTTQGNRGVFLGFGKTISHYFSPLLTASQHFYVTVYVTT